MLLPAPRLGTCGSLIAGLIMIDAFGDTPFQYADYAQW
jgi:hypothetical protein